MLQENKTLVKYVRELREDEKPVLRALNARLTMRISVDAFDLSLRVPFPSIKKSGKF